MENFIDSFRTMDFGIGAMILFCLWVLLVMFFGATTVKLIYLMIKSLWKS